MSLHLCGQVHYSRKATCGGQRGDLLGAQTALVREKREGGWEEDKREERAKKSREIEKDDMQQLLHV